LGESNRDVGSVRRMVRDEESGRFRFASAKKAQRSWNRAREPEVSSAEKSYEVAGIVSWQGGNGGALVPGRCEYEKKTGGK